MTTELILASILNVLFGLFRDGMVHEGIDTEEFQEKGETT